MSLESFAALITATAAFLGVTYSIWSARDQDKKMLLLEERRSKLTREEAAEKARIEYEYEGRKRLYAEFEPLRFRLFDLAAFALECIEGLTEPAIWKDFRQADWDEDLATHEHRAVMAAGTYPLVSTLYGLLAPLVIVRFMSRKLTVADLALDPRIDLQFYLATRAYGVIKDDAFLAARHPPVKYEPFADDWRERRLQEPDKYWWQGLTMGRLETALDLLVVESQEDGERLASFGEFERRYQIVLAGGDLQARKAMAAASNALVSFTPSDRPVFWRVLMSQACLYDALLRTGLTDYAVPTTEDEWTALLQLRDPHRFDWKGDAGDARDAPHLDDTMHAVESYLAMRVIAPRIHRQASPAPVTYPS